MFKSKSIEYLKKHRKYSRIYVDDYIIFSKTLKEHLHYLIKVFNTSNINNIFIKLINIFIEYFIINLFDQKIIFFNLAIAKNKIKIIFLLKFLRILQQLKNLFKTYQLFTQIRFILRKYIQIIINSKNKIFSK